MKRSHHSQPNPDWIVFDNSVGRCCCRHCGATLNLPLPQRVEIFVAAAMAFARIHRNCPEPVIPNPPIIEVIQ